MKGDCCGICCCKEDSVFCCRGRFLSKRQREFSGLPPDPDELSTEDPEEKETSESAYHVTQKESIGKKSKLTPIDEASKEEQEEDEPTSEQNKEKKLGKIGSYKSSDGSQNRSDIQQQSKVRNSSIKRASEPFRSITGTIKIPENFILDMMKTEVHRG